MVSITRKGNLVPLPYMTAKEKKELDNHEPLKYIMDFLEQRIARVGIPEKIKPKGIGSRVLVLKSGTGSGKSTTVPPAIYNNFFETTRRNIVVTQPSVLTAVDIPYQIINYNANLKIGDNIGYQTGIVQKKPVKGILFATVGVLQQQLIIMDDESIINKYAFIIIDEVHKRDIQTDMVLFYLKRFLQSNWDNARCPFVILMSATFDPKIFMDYFECPDNHFIEVKGLSYPIEDKFSNYAVSDYINYASDVAQKIHIDNLDDIKNNEEFRDIMIFVQSSKDINKITNLMHKFNADILSQSEATIKEYSGQLNTRIEKNKIEDKRGGKEAQYYICPVRISRELQNEGGADYRNRDANISKIEMPIYSFKQGPQGIEIDKVLRYVKPSRKVFISTNIAETGLTINTLKYCIDTGFVKSSEFNPCFGIALTVNKPVPKSSAVQRRGRVGRKSPGIWYPCFPKDVFENMIELSYPDIVASDITDMVLSLIISETESELRPAAPKEISEVEEFNLNKYSSRRQNKKTLSKKEIDEEKIINTFQISAYTNTWLKLEVKKVFDAKNMDFLQFPSADSMQYSLEKLYNLGFIKYDYSPTLFGFYACKIRKLKLENVRMIFAGYHHGANILDLITIACMREINPISRWRKYKPRNPLKLSDRENFYYYKLLIGDEFVEMLFIWLEYMSIIGQITDSSFSKINSPFDKLRDWASENKFNLANFYQITELRDEIIANFLALGINPFYNGLDLSKGTYNLVSILKKNLKEGLEEVIKIKKCIYEGYRQNLAIWSDVSKNYILHNSHAPLSLSSNIVSPINELTNKINADKDENAESNEVIRPKSIIVGQVDFKEGFIPGKYEFSGNIISILDGFIDIDIEYGNY